MRIFNLDFVDDDADIQVYIPGPVGPPLVDVGSVLVPVSVSGSIAAPVNRRQRSFISAASIQTQPTIPNPSDNGPWELFLLFIGPNRINLDQQTNILLSGPWTATDGSMLYLQWDGHSKYREAGRNEI